MKKQYITETVYEGNTKITFYEDGSCKDYTIISDWKLDGYLEAKQEDGWVEAYSQRQLKEALGKIVDLKEELSWWEKHVEEIKNNLIGAE